MQRARAAGVARLGRSAFLLALLLGTACLLGRHYGASAEPIAAPGAAGQPQPAAAYLVHVDGSGSVRLPDGVSRLLWAPGDDRYALVQLVAGTATVAVAGAADPDTSTAVFESTDRIVSDVQWSPDGSSLAILAGAGLQIVSADGSAEPRQIADQVYAFAWTPDGTELTIVQWDGEPGHGESLTTVAATDGRALDRILPVQTRVCPSRLAWSADGTLLAFSAGLFQNPVCGDQRNTAQGLWLWDQTAHALKQLEKQPIAPLPHWTPDGRVVAEREDDPFARAIVAYTPAGAAQTLAAYQDNCRELQDLGAGVQVDGGSLLYIDTSGDLPQIVAVPLAGGDPVVLSPAGRYTALPLLSPDGSAVAYSSAGDGDYADLAIAGTDGRPRAAVAGDGISLRAESWSSDGSLLFVLAQSRPLQRCG